MDFHGIAVPVFFVLIGLYQLELFGDCVVVVGKNRHKQFLAAQQLQCIFDV